MYQSCPGNGPCAAPPKVMLSVPDRHLEDETELTLMGRLVALAC
jgi:hypothetical protein